MTIKMVPTDRSLPPGATGPRAHPQGQGYHPAPDQPQYPAPPAPPPHYLPPGDSHPYLPPGPDPAPGGEAPYVINPPFAPAGNELYTQPPPANDVPATVPPPGQSHYLPPGQNSPYLPPREDAPHSDPGSGETPPHYLPNDPQPHYLPPGGQAPQPQYLPPGGPAGPSGVSYDDDQPMTVQHLPSDPARYLPSQMHNMSLSGGSADALAATVTDDTRPRPDDRYLATHGPGGPPPGLATIANGPSMQNTLDDALAFPDAALSLPPGGAPPEPDKPYYIPALPPGVPLSSLTSERHPHTRDAPVGPAPPRSVNPQDPAAAAAWQQFQRLDRDGDGRVSALAWAQSLTEAGMGHVTLDQALQAMTAAGVDRDGGVDFEGYQRLMQQVVWGVGRRDLVWGHAVLQGWPAHRDSLKTPPPSTTIFLPVNFPGLIPQYPPPPRRVFPTSTCTGNGEKPMRTQGATARC